MAPGPGPPSNLSQVATPRPSSTSKSVRKSMVAPSGEEASRASPADAPFSVQESEDEAALRAALRAAQELKDFLVKTEGSALRGWCKHLDTAHEQRIGHSEFVRGMRKLNYPGDPSVLFETLDNYRTGELALEEIDAHASDQWRSFRAFCVMIWESPDDMVKKLGRGQIVQTNKGQAQNWSITLEDFVEGLRVTGWTGGYEDVIFSALNSNDKPAITTSDLEWLDKERKRQKRKELAKRKALVENAKRVKDNNWKAAEAVLMDFKQFLKRKYGNYVRAWLSGMSTDGGMVLQRHELYKACSKIGWQGDVKLLFKAFDKDVSGYISIEELDPKAAELLAWFRNFTVSAFGDAKATFEALDKFNQKKVKQAEFCGVLKAYGFGFPAKAIFQGLDHRQVKFIVADDLAFLDRWKPRAFLTKSANPQAMEELKAALIRRYKNYLKAWRHCLDLDSSNRCNYDEFEAACKTLSFKGDVPGAWRALDEDLSGYITLLEVDSVSSNSLARFKKWCDDEFGNVRSAFGVFDTSGDNEVNYREWRRALRFYGFRGDANTLFYALDVEKNGSLSIDEVDFLDDWTFPEPGSAEDDGELPSLRELGLLTDPSTDMTTQFVTDSPGPAAYKTPTTIGAGPVAPMLRFGGAHSMGKRLDKKPAASDVPCPQTYDDLPGLAAVCPSKPAWCFGSEARAVCEDRQIESQLPGPGQYNPLLPAGPSMTCTPRRPLKQHPLFQNFGFRGASHSLSPRKDWVAPLPRI